LGENYAVSAYAGNPDKGLFTLRSVNRPDVDAFAVHGRSYAIKSVSSLSKTGTFHFGDKFTEAHKAFNFLVVVHVGPDLQLLRVLEFTWARFFAIKKRSERQQAWFLPLSKASVATAHTVFPLH